MCAIGRHGFIRYHVPLYRSAEMRAAWMISLAGKLKQLRFPLLSFDERTRSTAAALRGLAKVIGSGNKSKPHGQTLSISVPSLKVRGMEGVVFDFARSWARTLALGARGRNGSGTEPLFHRELLMKSHQSLIARIYESWNLLRLRGCSIPLAACLACQESNVSIGAKQGARMDTVPAAMETWRAIVTFLLLLGGVTWESKLLIL